MIDYLQWVLIGLTSVLVASTVLPLSGVRFGAIRGLSFFRLQFFWLAAATPRCCDGSRSGSAVD